MKWLDRLFSDEEEKVGMVGDGANDLLAIKEANLGIGIRNCDSSYAASFSILKLMDIDYIIREAKCAEREIIEICRYNCIGAFLTIPIIIIMETEASFFSSFQLIFNNFTKSLIIPILLALSRPAAEQVPYKPASNFLKKQNQLIVWGSIIISTLAFSATIIYMRGTSEYIKNTTRADVNSGWTSNDYLVAS
jgi:magnesium-transporting ATPase (P-type)